MTIEQITGLIGVIGGPVLGFLVYRRSVKGDVVSSTSGAADSARASMAQIIDGLNSLIDNLQEDNQGFRDQIRYLTDRLETVIGERNQLQLEVVRMRRKYGENGD